MSFSRPDVDGSSPARCTQLDDERRASAVWAVAEINSYKWLPSAELGELDGDGSHAVL